MACAGYYGYAATGVALKALQKVSSSTRAERILAVCAGLMRESLGWELSTAHQEPLRPLVYAAHTILSAGPATTDVASVFKYVLLAIVFCVICLL